MEVFTACGTPFGACLADVNLGPINFNLPPATYWLRVFTTEVDAGTFTICMDGPPPAANDEPCTATPLTLGVGDCVMQLSTTENATNSTAGTK